MPAVPGGREAEVIVVGAGLAGLVAARQLVAARRDVLVLEARDRVGGRTANASIGAGKVTEMGGQWVGPTQDRVLGLAQELGIETFPTFYEGRNLLDLGGRIRRYKGTIPRLAPLALLDLDRARRKLRKAARGVPADAPWTAPNATRLDSQTLATWVRKAARTKKARALLEIATGTVMGTGISELSLLWMLSYVNSAGSFDALIDTEGGAQQDRFVGGSQLISQRLAEALGEAVVLSAPVRRIAQDSAGLEVEADGVSARAQRVIVAVPPPLAARISFTPSLGGRRDQLTQRMANGALTKCAAVYSEPFWRADGLTGQAVTDRGPVTTTFDNSPPDGSPGVLLGFIAGPEAIRHARRSEADRRRMVLEGFTRLFGPEAAKPGIYLETAWAEEEWSRGGPVCSFAPGALSQYGEALRQPTGRVHWAGAETATVWCGYMDGAVRSGERAAEEVLDAEGWRL
jgi:monoamine oxidase